MSFYFLSASSREAHVSRNHLFCLFLSVDFHKFQCSVMSICLFTEVIRAMGYVSTGMGDRLSSGPAMGCV